MAACVFSSLFLIFQMAGVDHRGLGVFGLPGNGLLFVTFHGILTSALAFAKKQKSFLGYSLPPKEKIYQRQNQPNNFPLRRYNGICKGSWEG